MYGVNYKTDYKSIYDLKLSKSAKKDKKVIKTYIANNVYKSVTVRVADMSENFVVAVVNSLER